MSQSSGKNFSRKQNTPVSPSAFQPYITALQKSAENKTNNSNAPEEPECKPKPKLEVVNQDGFVSKIKVTCSCGEVIEIDCDYD